MRELYLHVPPNYTAQTTDNSHDFVYTQMQCVCMRYNYYKFTKIHNYIQSYTYLFLFCSFSEFMAYIYCNISKISQFKISTNVLNIFPMLYKMYRFLKKENMHFKHESVCILWKKWSNHNFWTGLLYIINYFLWIKKNYNHLYEFHLWKR